MLDKITDYTKVKEWVVRINEMIDLLDLQSYVWETTSVIGQKDYVFNVNEFKKMPLGGKFIVTYGGVELHKNDYEISGVDTLKLTNEPEETGYPIRIRYVGE